MPSRLRIFVKKRGTRRTGARWPGLLAEALLLVGLIALGVYGAYWLIAHELAAEAERFGWWAWFALLIPIALIGLGATGLVLLLWQNVASSERRSAAVQRAADWELVQTVSDRPTLPAVPPIDSVTDSPGVRLAFRLPIDASSGWVSLTMAFVCLAWNSLVAFFVYRVIQQHFAGRPNWLLTWLLLPFVLAGAWTLFVLARQIMFDVVVGTTRIEISHHPFYPGQTYQGFISQTGRLHLRWFQVLLMCEEQAVYQQGTDTRRETTCVYRGVLFHERKFDITPDHAYESSFDFTVPASAMHSFLSPHNGVVWTICVRALTARWGRFERRFPVFVHPPTATHTPPREELAAATRS